MFSENSNRLHTFFDYPIFVFSVITEFFQPAKFRKLTYDILIKQILFTGYEALGIISLFAFSIGAIIIIQGNSNIPNFGQSTFFYTTLVTVVLKELGGIITALIVIARSGTAIATELGNMSINNEIEALESMGVSPLAYLIIPRTLGVVISLITLSIYFSLMALVGSWLLSNFYFPIEFTQFLSDLFEVLKIGDLFLSILKSFVFGFLIATISGYHGLQVAKATTEIPQRTIKAVVYSIGALIVFDILINILYYLL